ncbi:MAG: putative transposase [Magnetococcales bacterium]|nr:putative transposase [Magnetococcales bacterium]
MRYLLVDEHRYQEGELKPMRNVVAALFRLERSRRLEDVRCVIEELDSWLKSPEQRELRRAFAKWLSRILLPRLSKRNIPIPESLPEMDDLEEVRTMLAETAEGWTREWKREGHQEGEASMLMRLLQRRFGTVPAWANNKITKADLSSLEEWSLRFVDAQSLEDVFSDKV